MATEERELHVVFGSGPVGRAVAAELVRGLGGLQSSPPPPSSSGCSSPL